MTWLAFHFLTRKLGHSSKSLTIIAKRKRVEWRGLATNRKVFIRVTVSIDAIVIASATRYAGCRWFACKRRISLCRVDENSGTRGLRNENKKKRKKKEKQRIRGKRAYFFLCRKGSIICHLLGLKVSDEGSRVENWPLEKNGRVYKRRPEQRDIFADENGLEKRRHAGTSCRNLSARFFGETKTALLFRA